MSDLLLQHFCNYQIFKSYPDYILFKHEGGIQALKVRTEDPDGWVQYIWDLTDFTMESNEEWWMAQVNFNTHKVYICYLGVKL